MHYWLLQDWWLRLVYCNISQWYIFSTYYFPSSLNAFPVCTWWACGQIIYVRNLDSCVLQFRAAKVDEYGCVGEILLLFFRQKWRVLTRVQRLRRFTSRQISLSLSRWRPRRWGVCWARGGWTGRVQESCPVTCNACSCCARWGVWVARIVVGLGLLHEASRSWTPGLQ